MIVFQPIYGGIFKIIYTITGKIPEKTRNVIIIMLLIILEGVLIAGYSSNYFSHKISLNDRAIIGTGVLLLICIFSIKTPLKKIKWSYSLSTIWFVLFLVMFLSGCDHIVGDGYKLSALALLIGLPGLVFVWNNRGDYDVLYRLTAKAITIVHVVYFIGCLIMSPTQDLPYRYSATIDNPNTLGLMAVTGLICATYLFITEKKYAWIYTVPFGVSIAFGVASVSRNAIIAMILVLAVVIIYGCKLSIFGDTELKEVLKIAIVKMGVLLGVSLICVMVLNMSIRLDNTVVAAGMSSSKTMSTEENQSETTITIEQTQPSNSLSERFNIDGKSLDVFSAGRVEIWKAYAQHLNIKGNDIKKNEFPIGDSSSKYLAAHNVYLEYAYRSGILAGVLFLILVIMVGIKALMLLFSRKPYKTYYLFVIMATGAYGFTSLFESLVHPFSRSIVFLFYIAIIPFWEKTNKETSGKHIKTTTDY